MKRICVQCGEEFFIADSEVSFYKNKGLSIPKRCKACRDTNRKTKAGMNYDNTQKNYNKDITVDTKTSRKPKPQAQSNRKVYLMVALLVALVIGGITLFSDNSSNNSTTAPTYESVSQYKYNFANEEALVEHFNKHGAEFGYTTKEAYLQGANNVIQNPNATKKTEADGDYVYYVQSSNEIVFVSPSGTIRTYFRPTDGIAYFNRTQILIMNF
mgnify:CR=1 FL=1